MAEETATLEPTPSVETPTPDLGWDVNYRGYQGLFAHGRYGWYIDYYGEQAAHTANISIKMDKEIKPAIIKQAHREIDERLAAIERLA